MRRRQCCVQCNWSHTFCQRGTPIVFPAAGCPAPGRAMAEDTIHTGTVSWFSVTKGYGAWQRPILPVENAACDCIFEPPGHAARH